MSDEELKKVANEVRKGIVTGGGIGGANAAPKHADVMRKAYELGNKL